ncbi:unnamed protein product [Coffea canephora]|uniref:Uncharacterized protein n=1 Tax=Coffea canephora TaxID=49390 RepID=A0A068USH0_COFCA|nr:unnamed protein product [Coffea canephora]
MGHFTNPFSLHSEHLIAGPSSGAMILRLPLQLKHSTNFIPAQPVQAELFGVRGIPCRSFLSIPLSCNPITSSAPPIYLPRMNSLGGTTLCPITLQSSSLYSKCIATSLSWYSTRKLSKRNRMLVQSSKVFLIPLMLVV